MEKPDYESTKITGSELSEGDPRDRVETVEDDDEDLNIRGKDKVTSNFQSCFYYQMQTMKDPEEEEEDSEGGMSEEEGTHQPARSLLAQRGGAQNSQKH